jgi:lipopolysaccharide export system protein LptC
MLILTEQDIVKTDRLVEAKEGRTVLRGTGMTADSSKQTLALHSQVSARYMAPEQVKR